MDGIKKMKLSQYFEIKKPIYEALQITPHSSIRNYNSSTIAKMITEMYKSISKQIHKIEKQLIIETSVKCSYIIDITKNDICFYFLVPKQYKNIAKEKIMSVWPSATINDCVIPTITGQNMSTYQLKYKNLDAFSLGVDKKSNRTLNSVLNVVDIMESEDRICICYNLIPCNQYAWRASCKNAHDKYIKNDAIEKEFGITHIINSILNTIINIFYSVLDGLGSDITNGSPLDQLRELLFNRKKEISELSMRKYNSNILETQIAIVSSSNNKDRAINNAISVCQGFRVLDADNELTYKKAPKI